MQNSSKSSKCDSYLSSTVSSLCAGLLLFFWYTTATATPVEDTEKGIEAYNRGDVAAAMEHFLSAAEAGYAPAQIRLAYIYDKSESNEEAIIWYRKAIEQNSEEAKYRLGEMYVSGDGVEQDFKQGVLLITEAAEQGYVQAMRNLAIAYERGGLDLEVDHEQTVHWLKMAAGKDDQWAIGRLVQAYSHGELGLPADNSLAQEWKARQTAKGAELEEQY